LLAQGTLVEEVAEDTEEEDGDCEAVTGFARVSARELGQDFVVVF
jgi:hypothetical protein